MKMILDADGSFIKIGGDGQNVTPPANPGWTQVVINRADNKEFSLADVAEEYGQAELTNRLLDWEPGVDAETAEEWAQPIICKDGRRGQAFYIFDRDDYPDGYEDMADAAEFLPWHDESYIVAVYVED